MDQGFERSQFSVYARFVNGKEGFEAHIKRTERNLPDWGDIQVFQFTDKRYENMLYYSDQGRQKSKRSPQQLMLFLKISIFS